MPRGGRSWLPIVAIGSAPGRVAALLLASIKEQRFDLPAASGIDLFAAPPPRLASVEVDADSVNEAQDGSTNARRAVLTVDVSKPRNDDSRLQLRLQYVGVSQTPGSGCDSAAQLGPSCIPLAWADFNDTMKSNGWSFLTVGATADKRITPALRAYGAGYLEGVLSAQHIRNFRHNVGPLLKHEEQKHHALDAIRGLFAGELDAIRHDAEGPGFASSSSSGSRTSQWRAHAWYALAQSWGVLDAYNSRAAEVNGDPMSLIDLMVLSSDGETPDLEAAYDAEEVALREDSREFDNSSEAVLLQLPSASPRHRRFAAELRALDDNQWRRIKRATGRCSALVRLAQNSSDLLVGHATFSDYSEMTRIFKFYDLPLGDESVRRMGFSSYPGVVGSTDDYYLLDSGLLVTETTISMLTDEPYDQINDNSSGALPDFMRIMLANRLARTGAEWVDLMSKSSTGTYSSQWMVVDYNHFEPGSSLKPGTLTVLEQVPGLSRSQDVTSILQRRGFWASENRAWFKEVRGSIGASEAEEIHGALFSAEGNPRAKIFASTAPSVQSLSDMRHEMRRNRWPSEEALANTTGYGYGVDASPDHAVAARGDLNADRPEPSGAVDSKVVNACLMKRLQCDAISGPTSDTQAPFRWRDAANHELFPGTLHDGMPNVWNFDWVRMSPEGETAVSGTGC